MDYRERLRNKRIGDRCTLVTVIIVAVSVVISLTICMMHVGF